MKKPAYGFTLVELLIVIVVIAILAAISIVAYNGVQTRANNTQTIDAVGKYIKAYSLHVIDHGNYPNASGCLGEDYPDNRCLSQSGAPCFGGLSTSTSMAVNNALKSYMNDTAPSPSLQRISCGGTTYAGAFASYSTASRAVTVIMMLKGDQTCPSMSPNVVAQAKQREDDVTRCDYRLGAI